MIGPKFYNRKGHECKIILFLVSFFLSFAGARVGKRQTIQNGKKMKKFKRLNNKVLSMRMTQSKQQKMIYSRKSFDI